jgi:hypothetical protein
MAQREGAGLLGDRLQARVPKDELVEPCAQVVVGVEEMGHWMAVMCVQPNRPSSPAKAGDPVFGRVCGKSHLLVITGCPLLGI